MHRSSTPKHPTLLLIGVALCIILLPRAYAQSSSSEIKGRVYDTDEEEWMTAASVRLLSATDSTLVEGVMTDKQGRFRLQVSTPGSYLVDISFIGYTPYRSYGYNFLLFRSLLSHFLTVIQAYILTCILCTEHNLIVLYCSPDLIP